MTRVRMRASRTLVVFLILSLAVVLLITARNSKSAPPLPTGRILPATPTDHPPNNLAPAPDKLSPDKLSPLLVLATNLVAPTTAPTNTAIAPTTAPAVAPAPTAPPTPIPDIVITRARTPLIDARSKLATDPLAVQRILNDELLSGHFAGPELDEARELLGKAGEQLVFSPRPYRDDPHATAYTIQPGDRLVKIAAGFNITSDLLIRINNIPDPRRIKPGQQLKAIRGPFHAVVTKSRFNMDLYLGAPGGPGSTFITSYPVGLGKDDSTPIGAWKAAGKLINPVYYSPRGEGIIAADDPKNPLGEFWIGLSGIDGGAQGKSSYGIHGTIDPTSIGRTESMGCIRMRNEDVAVVYELLVESKSTILVRD